jgi:predicted 3-demethylubiquinone-9 3-methyltransferase (glyoxalase superfamily)
MPAIARISPCLWFDDQAEDAARFYTGIFRNSHIDTVSRYSKAGFEVHHRPAGSVAVVAFRLDGEPFTALNGGPLFKFTEAISLQVHCKDQDEIDYYWTKLGAGGDPKAQQCGWLKDKYGLSWQIVPDNMDQLASPDDQAAADRVMIAMLPMKKIDKAALERAHAGK